MGRKKKKQPKLTMIFERYSIYRVVIMRSDIGKTWFRLESTNGKIIMSSEQYARPGGAYRQAQKVAEKSGHSLMERINPIWGSVY